MLYLETMILCVLQHSFPITSFENNYTFWLKNIIRTSVFSILYLEERDSPIKHSFNASLGNVLVGKSIVSLLFGFSTLTCSSSAICSVNRCSGNINCWSCSSMGSSFICLPDMVTCIRCRHFHLRAYQSYLSLFVLQS